MPKYKFIATAEDGSTVRGVLPAVSRPAAHDELIGYRLDVRRLTERKRLREIELGRKRVRPEEIMDFSRHLGAFLRAGVPLTTALATIAEECSSPRLKPVLDEIDAALHAGETFADAIAAHATHFPPYYVGTLRSAELTGRLDRVLDQLAGYIERDLEARRKVQSALAYPGVILAMSLIAIVVLVVFVLPRFESFFEDFGAELPLPTRMLLGMSAFVSQWGWLVGVVVVALGLVLSVYGRSERGRLTRDRLRLRLPVLGEVARYSIIERFCRILATMIRAGVPATESIKAAIASTNNRVYATALTEASEKVLRGEGLSRPLAETGMIPATVIQMMRVGEQTGTLDEQLAVAADHYQSELAHKLKRLTTIFEPAVIVIVGVVVGFVAIALVSAMYGIFNQQDIG